MYRVIILLTIFVLACSCSRQEYSIEDEQSIGLYSRTSDSVIEYLCLRGDKSYTYSIKESGELKVVVENKWQFEMIHGESRIVLEEFNYMVELKRFAKEPYSINAPILFSEAKSKIIIRMDPDDHFRDFVKIQESSCDIES